ncbi:MAG: murein biosynthesis integral membrane protein MurJ [Gemmatimonadota bacterium]
MNRRATGPATAVGTGILISRVTGLFRDVAVAAFLGTRFAADAYWAAIKIPNIIRNLLGEGTLSAAFVPVYSAALGESASDPVAPVRLSRSVLGIVAATALALSALGVLVAPWITDVLMVGSAEPTRELTTRLVRILFPMSGVLIIGAWFLGVLNSHGRFFLPFVAPAIWNLTQVAGLLLAVRLGSNRLAEALAWSALLGAVIQVVVQVPLARRLSGVDTPRFELSYEPVRRVARNTIPVISSQGVLQVSSLVDIMLASLAGPGAMAALGYSQRLAYLPISLFGISVAAAALPSMSREAQPEALRARLTRGWFQILFFVLPAAVVLLLFGDLAVGLVYQRREFGGDSTALVAAVLATYALGLVAASSIKLFAAGYHAMQDTSTPMRIAVTSVAVAVVVSVSLTLTFRRAGMGAYSAMGIAMGSSVGSWTNLVLLWVLLGRRIGPLFDSEALGRVLRIGLAAAAAGGAGFVLRAMLEPRVDSTSFAGRFVVFSIVLVAGAIVYFSIAGRPPGSRTRRSARDESREEDGGGDS